MGKGVNNGNLEESFRKIFKNFNFIDENEEIQAEIKQQKMLERKLLNGAGIPKKYLAQAKEHENSFFTESSILFFGNTGSGKTTRAINLLLNLIKKGLEVKYIDEMALSLIDNFNSQKIDDLIKIDVLYIDDLGIISNQDKFLLKKIKIILLKRFELSKQTILTTNYSLLELFGENISDKLKSEYVVKLIKNESLRKPKGVIK